MPSVLKAPKAEHLVVAMSPLEVTTPVFFFLFFFFYQWVFAGEKPRQRFYRSNSEPFYSLTFPRNMAQNKTGSVGQLLMNKHYLECSESGSAVLKAS